MPRLLFEKAIPEHFGYGNSNKKFLTDEEIHFNESICFKNQKEKYCYRLFSEDDKRRIETSYYIGVDWLKNQELVIQVQPKLNSAETQTDYLKMLSVAMSHPGTSDFVKDIYEIKFDSEPIPINQQDDLLTPLLVIQYVNLLKSIVRKGLIKSYHKQESNLKSRIKGKILVGQSIKENLVKNKPLYTKCSFEVFDEDVPVNRILKKALEFAKRYMNQFNLKLDQDKLNYIAPAFERVTTNSSQNEVKNIKINSFYKEYNEALALANLIMRRFGYNINSVDKSIEIKTPPFWIDMSLLFELYTLALLKDELQNDVLFQFHGNSVYPDYLIKSKKMVADAKYKPIYQGNSFDIDNIRQISGYARDMKVRAELGARDKEELECLIIYPDQSSANFDLKNLDTKLQVIDQFSGFYKVGVKLPVLRVNDKLKETFKT